MKKITIYKISEDYKTQWVSIKKGRYVAKFFYNEGWHYVILATPTEKQVYIGPYTLGLTKYEEVEDIESLKYLKPHFHKGLKLKIDENKME